MFSSKEKLSRRSLLGKGAALAGVAAMPLVFHSRQALAVSREALHYSDASPKPASHCGNCMSFILGATPDAMGGCFILKGIINPKGLCDGWSPKKS